MEKILFKTVGTEQLNLWVYDSGNPEKNKNRTAMLWIHGGGWNSGDPDYFGDDYDYFTERGIVCFSVEYRLVSKTDNDPYAERLYGAIEDCFDAFVYIKKNADKFGINPEKIAVVGESAGGHLALCFATDVVNKINKNAIPNLVIAYNPVTETLARWSQSSAKYSGISFSEDEFLRRHKILKNISPAHSIVKNNAPLLLLTGIDDNVVFPGDVMDFYERYTEVGNKSEIVLYPNTTHAFALPAWYDKGMGSRDKSLKEIEKFMQKYNFLGE